MTRSCFVSQWRGSLVRCICICIRRRKAKLNPGQAIRPSTFTSSFLPSSSSYLTHDTLSLPFTLLDSSSCQDEQRALRLRIPTMQQQILSASFNASHPTSDLAARPLLFTGSFTGFRNTIQELGYGYLTADKEKGQPLCGNAEGWGPLSKERYDFTPCFMDVWVSTVAVYGILFGAVAVWWLVRRKTRAVVERDWCFWCKHVGFSSLPMNS